jgi:hypothetical protein
MKLTFIKLGSVTSSEELYVGKVGDLILPRNYCCGNKEHLYKAVICLIRYTVVEVVAEVMILLLMSCLI